MRQWLMISAAAVVLAGCQAGAKPDAAAGSPEDPCGAAPFRDLVGKPGKDIDDGMFPAGTRVLRPGMVMTMDYRAERLNVVIGESGRVERVNCG